MIFSVVTWQKPVSHHEVMYVVHEKDLLYIYIYVFMIHC